MEHFWLGRKYQSLFLPWIVHGPEVRVQSVNDGLESEEQLGDVSLHIFALLGDGLDEARQNVGQHSRCYWDSQSPKYKSWRFVIRFVFFEIWMFYYVGITGEL